MRRVVLIAVTAVACGDGSAPANPDDARAPDDAARAPTIGELDEPTGIPAWDAVVERTRYLARRGDGGAVVGRLGAATGPYRWLIDETEGAGALGIRVALPEHAASLAEGARVQLAGAWDVDDDGRWFWRVSGVARIAGAEPIEFSRAPGHTIDEVEAPPDGAVPVSEAERGADIAFAVVAAPVKPGDGWQVADEPGADPVAWLVLPGERGAYGGQDMLAPDERWQLEVGARYTARIERRPRRSRGLRLLYAATPPARLLSPSSPR